MAAKRTPICTATDVFWAEIAPCEHLLQIYGDEPSLLDSLESFVSAGLSGGEAVIVIATEAHRAGLAARLRARGIDLASAIAANRYIPRDAEETLERFMRSGSPDEGLFEATVHQLLQQPQGGKVRAFGEMVALLWAQGMSGATVQLEHLWARLLQKRNFPLFCAYPKAGFTENAQDSFKAICAAHSRMVPAA